MNNKISVIIPFYNSHSTLRAAVLSVVEQDYLSIEIILVDDCSSDASPLIALDMQFKFANVTCLRTPSNLGVSAARNYGVAHSSGDYLTFLDSDDFYTRPSKISSAMKCIYRNQYRTTAKSIIAYSNSILCSSDGLNSLPIFTLFNRLPSNLFIYMTMLPRDFILPRSLFAQVGGFPESISIYEDWIFRLRLSRIAIFISTKSWDSVYRLSSSGLSKKQSFLYRLRILYSIVADEAKDSFGRFSFFLVPLFLLGLLLYHFYIAASRVCLGFVTIATRPS